MSDYIRKFVKRLNDDLRDTDLSRLRRASNDPSNDPRIFDILARLTFDMPKQLKTSLDLIATLYALAYQCPERNIERFNLGKTLKDKGWTDLRFRALLNTDRENLNFRLRQVFKFINSKGAVLNWETITNHILSWSHPKKWVQRTWAEGFFAPELSDNQEIKETHHVN